MESTTIEICDVDWAFADMIIEKYKLEKEFIRTFLARMMAQTRSSHICIEVTNEEVKQIPMCLLAEKDAANKLLKLHGSRLYFHRYWHLETKLLSPVLRRLDHKIDVKLVSIEGLNTEQSQAVSKALSHDLMLLTGGPGTGKTHTIACIVKQLDDQKIALTAPTGKAVSKLRQSMENRDYFFGTLHALLGVKEAKDVLKEAPILPYDVIIVDECSMIDIGMWGLLLQSCGPNTKLILVGDANQLPPVEGGNVFEELCRFFRKTQLSGLVELKKCMRTDRQDLQTIAEQVLNGHIENMHLEELPSTEELIKHLNPIFKQELPEKVSNEKLLKEVKKFQLLSALRKGPMGCDALNQAIFKTLARGRVAIPIIITRTCTDLGLSNGEVGIWIHEEDRVIFEHCDLPKALIPSFDLAYVLSVHKSQGSEYDNVYLLLPPGSEHFGRKVLYTAVTRARRQLTIAGSYDTVQLCVENKALRLSGLSDRLGEMVCKK